MWSKIKPVLVDVLSSKKAQAFLLAGISASLIRYFHLGEELAGKIADGILQLGMAYLVGQGLADFGKEAAKVEAKK